MSAWCCDSFDRLLSRAGEKGVSIIASNGDGGNRFVLQARPFEPDVVDLLNTPHPETGVIECPELLDKNGVVVPWVTSMDFPLTYCPRCGAHLQELIEDRGDEFTALADQMIRFR